MESRRAFEAREKLAPEAVGACREERMRSEIKIRRLLELFLGWIAVQTQIEIRELLR